MTAGRIAQQNIAKEAKAWVLEVLATGHDQDGTMMYMRDPRPRTRIKGPKK